MRTLIMVLSSLVVPALAGAQSLIPVTASQTGLSAEAIATTATSSAIHMEKDGYVTNQLDLTVAVTPGTSTRIRAWCTESDAMASGYAERSLCRGPKVPGAVLQCTPDLREYTLADYLTVSGVKYIGVRVHVSKPWVKCEFVDPDGGSGTITVTATRSWQSAVDAPETGYEPAYALVPASEATIDCSVGVAYSAQLSADAEYAVQARGGAAYVTQATAGSGQDADSGNLLLPENGIWMVGTHEGGRYITCDGSGDGATVVYQEVQ